MFFSKCLGSIKGQAVKLVVLVVLSLVTLTSAWAQLNLSSDTNIATAGHFRLNWMKIQPSQQQSTQSKTYELQQSKENNFNNSKTIYRGQDRSTVISGLANGQYYFRIKTETDDHWSKPIVIEVQHHSLTKAFSFFALGAVMFIALLTVLIKGARSSHAATNH